MHFSKKVSFVILFIGMTIPVLVKSQEKNAARPAALADSTFSIDKLDSIFS